MARAERSGRGRVEQSDCRCLCGSLVARRVPSGIELKCRRCKRTLVVALDGAVFTGAQAAPGRIPSNNLRPEATSPASRRLDPSPELVS